MGPVQLLKYKHLMLLETSQGVVHTDLSQTKQDLKEVLGLLEQQLDIKWEWKKPS